MKHLTLADEIVVLMLHDDMGTIRPDCASVANIAIAGGILMELALLGRIDTDLTSLFIAYRKLVGDDFPTVRRSVRHASHSHWCCASVRLGRFWASPHRTDA